MRIMQNYLISFFSVFLVKFAKFSDFDLLQFCHLTSYRPIQRGIRIPLHIYFRGHKKSNFLKQLAFHCQELVKPVSRNTVQETMRVTTKLSMKLKFTLNIYLCQANCIFVFVNYCVTALSYGRPYCCLDRDIEDMAHFPKSQDLLVEIYYLKSEDAKTRPPETLKHYKSKTCIARMLKLHQYVQLIR